MKTRAGHLRLVPKPLAKCEAPPPRAYPPTWDGYVEVRRVGQRWRLIWQDRGRVVEIGLTTAALRDLVEQGAKLLERNEDDVDER